MSLTAVEIYLPNAAQVVRELSERWLTPEGRIKLLPAEEFRSVPYDHLRVWLHDTARYSIPTLELVTWLKEQIDGRSAIEVGAGNGDLGWHLGIPSTDSYIQQSPELQMMYSMSRQVPTNPFPDTRKMNAYDAINHYKPKVVVASWLTRKFIKGKDKEGKAQASIYGPEEEKIISRCKAYFHVGNIDIHGQKTILSKPHESFHLPFIVSRGENQQNNVVWRWGR